MSMRISATPLRTNYGKRKLRLVTSLLRVLLVGAVLECTSQPTPEIGRGLKRRFAESIAQFVGALAMFGLVKNSLGDGSRRAAAPMLLAGDTGHYEPVLRGPSARLFADTRLLLSLRV